MARIMEVADAAIGEIADWFRTGGEIRLKYVGVHRGNFTPAELERLATAAPALYLAVRRTTSNESSGAEDALGDAASGDPVLPPIALNANARRDVLVEFGMAVVARDEGRDRDATRVAESIVSELLRRIPECQWGLDGVGPATEVASANAFDTRLADKGFTLWTLTWTQRVRLGRPWPAGETPTELCVTVRGDDPVPVAESS